MNQLSIARPTRQSLYIESFFKNKQIASGTAFTVNSSKGHILITNWHNVSGKDKNGNLLFGGFPDELRIYYYGASTIKMEWIVKSIKLYKDELMLEPLWIEHPIHKFNVDFVGILIEITNDISVDSIPINQKYEIFDVQPGDNVNVVGFPFGLTNGIKGKDYFPIWSCGFIATDIQIDYNNLPLHLIDCKSRPGQSGSPVIAMRRDVHTNNMPCCYKFLGIYSGRINDESDLGFVWKVEAIKELVTHIEKL